MSQPANLLAPEVRADPYPFYRRLREEHPVCEITPGGFFAVSRYDDVMYVLRNPQLFSSSGYHAFMLPSWLDENPMVRSVLARDPPDHAVLRTRLGRALSARMTPALEARVRDIAAELCVRLDTQEEVDFIDEFAAPLPARVFAELCGLDPSMHEHFKRWADDLSAISPVITRPQRIAAICTSVKEVDAYLRQVIAARRRAPGDDLVSDLLAPDSQGQSLDEQDVLGLLFLLLPAGFDTTTYLLAACARILADRPDEVRRLREDPAAIGDFIQEVLRYDSPVHGVMRRTTQRVELHGVTLPPNTVVCALLTSANRDERKFTDPDRFDPSQQRAKDMAFGHGIHHCLGASLARMEVQIALHTLLTRFSQIELTQRAIRWNNSLIIRGPLTQKMRWSALRAPALSLVPHRPARVIRLLTEARDVPLSGLTRLLAEEITQQFGERVLVVRGHASLPDRLHDSHDVVLLEGATPTSFGPETVVSLHRGPAPGSSDRHHLQTLLVDGPVDPEPFFAAPLERILASRPPHRLHLRRGDSRHGLGDRTLADLDPETRDTLARWARALTGRQVGLALSGGGAWGFTHVALLRKLHQRRVPIDLITGSSMGSVVGAYYCARGLGGLDLLIEGARSGDIGRVALQAILSTAVVQRQVEADLGPLPIGALRTPFHAALTEVDSGEDVAVLAGPLGLAVRASSSAPGIFGPTLIEGRRYIDGSMSNHVPADLVRTLGADLVLAANCYPSGRRAAGPARAGLSALWHSLRPLGRLSDLLDSANLLLHRSGRRGGAAADVLYEITPKESPLLWAADFRKVDAVLALAERDERLERAAAALADRWHALCKGGPAIISSPSVAKEAA